MLVLLMDSALELSFWIRVGVSILCGGAIGLERQLRGKPAGVRTSILICLGSMMYVSLGSVVVTEYTDPTRIIGQVVVGVGFLGGGTILSERGSVKGLTSAATVWLLAAVGATLGLEQYASAVGLTLTVLFVLIGIEMLERSFAELRRGAHRPHRDEHNDADSSGDDANPDPTGSRSSR